MAPPQGLKATIHGLVSDHPTRKQTRQFVALCHRLARTYLAYKQRHRRLHPSLLGLSIDDLALDSIASLFERDARGCFPHLVQYFNRLDWQDADDVTLLAATRRLVFSAVNDRLFEYYHDLDASLSNLIRSLKRVASSTAGVTLKRRRHRLWILIDDGRESDAKGLLMPPEFLEGYLTAAIRQGTTMSDLLSVTAQVFRTQALYTSTYPVAELAKVIRAAWVKVHEAEPAPFPPSTKLHRESMVHFIEHSVAATQAAMWTSYVAQGKVGEDVFASYFMAIRDRLTAQFADNDGKTLTNYQALQAYLPGLSRETYGSTHRPVFEYLSKCAREHLVKQLQREL